MNSNDWTVTHGWLNSCRHLHSPFFNRRPENTDVSLLVIHNISLPRGQFQTGNVDKLFLGFLNPSDPMLEGQAADVSSHLVIDREGAVTQYVSFEERAWHAGISDFEGQKDCNDFSIGIELEGTDDVRFTDIQYQTLNQLIRVLQQNYPIQDVVGHEQIAPGRRTDPGPAFDWQRVEFNRSEQ